MSGLFGFIVETTALIECLKNLLFFYVSNEKKETLKKYDKFLAKNRIDEVERAIFFSLVENDFWNGQFAFIVFFKVTIVFYLFSTFPRLFAFIVSELRRKYVRRREPICWVVG